MDRVEVLTINLRRQDERDGPNDWPVRRKYTVRCVQDLAPDVFGTQEGRHPQLLDMLQGLQGYRLADDHRSWDPSRFYPCIFYRSERLDLLDAGDRWLSETPDIHASKSWGSAFPRLATWARFRMRENGRELLFAATHLDNISAPARAGQAEMILRLLQEVNKEGLPVVLVGDFNDLPGSEPHRIVTARYVDAWQRFHPGGAEADTWHGFSGEGQRGRLDWVMISQEITVLDIEIICTSYDGNYPSDHFPVRARLSI